MKFNCYYIIIISLLSSSLYSQKLTDDFDISLDGSYVRYEAYYDNRQVVGSSLDGKLLFPERKLPSAQRLGDLTQPDDINAKGQGQMAAFRTRTKITVSGPKINSAKAKGVLECDFEGRSGIVNIFHIRQAFVQIDTEKTTMLFGQAWHPIRMDDISPETISFNDGRPLEVYARSPQIRFTYHAPSLDIISAATAQIDFLSDGPDGEDTKYSRNAVIPNLHLHLKGFYNDHIMSVGVDYKRLTPRIQTNKKFKVRENISSWAGVSYLAFRWPSISFLNKLTFGQNMSNYDTIGGYAVKKGSIDPITDERRYTNFRTLAFWSTLVFTKNKKFEPAIFIGVAKNFGSSDEIEQNVVDPNTGEVTDKRIFGLEDGQFNDIDTVFRVSPRLRVKIKKVVLAGEIEYTRAGYGDIGPKGKVTNIRPVGNTRVLFAAHYYF